MVDNYLENLTQWVTDSIPVIQTTAVTWGLIAYHWASLAFETSVVFLGKTYKGVMDAHTPSHWIFMERNTVPWSVKEGPFHYPLTFTPSEMCFKSNKGSEKGSFSDVVTVELRNSDKTLVFDLTSFFHQITWYGDSPSLYEVVLVYCLANNHFYNCESFKAFTLEVMTADSAVVSFHLSECMENFKGWVKAEPEL